jgi:hypothetical protein
VATFTMEVADELVPRISAAIRSQYDLLEIPHEGYTDIQVVRHYTKDAWKNVVGHAEGQAAHETAKGEADDALDQGVEGV